MIATSLGGWRLWMLPKPHVKPSNCMLCILCHRAAYHSLRKALSAPFHMQDVKDAHNFRVSLWLTGDREYAPPTQQALTIFWPQMPVESLGFKLTVSRVKNLLVVRGLPSGVTEFLTIFIQQILFTSRYYSVSLRPPINTTLRWYCNTVIWSKFAFGTMLEPHPLKVEPLRSIWILADPINLCVSKTFLQASMVLV